MASPHPMLGAIPGFWAVAFCRAGFAGCSSRCVLSCCRIQAQMLGIPAGVDQKDIYEVVAVLASGSRSSTFFRSAEADSHGPVSSADHRRSPVAVRWSMFPLCGRVDSQMLPWRRHSSSHSCSSLRNQILSTTLRIWQSLVRCVA